jgi:hypothetical protein
MKARRVAAHRHAVTTGSIGHAAANADTDTSNHQNFSHCIFLLFI